MKRITLTTIAGSLLLAAGCAHKEKSANYQSSTSYPAYADSSSSSRFNQAYDTTRTAENTTAAPGTSQSYSSSPQVSSSVNQNTFQSQTDISAGDTTLVNQVRTALNNDTTLVSVAPSIQVTAQNGTVTLSGNVSNEQQKQTIEHLVKGTSGVVTVNNQLQVSPSATGGSSQSSIYSNSTSQVQGTVSSLSTPSASTSASADLKGRTDTNQSSTSTSDTSLSATSDKTNSRLYSTKDDFSTNKSNSSVGASGEASLGSTNSGSFSTQDQGPNSSKGGTSSWSTNSQGGATSPGSSGSGSSTNQSSIGTSSSVSTPSTSDTSLGSTNTSTTETKDKDLTATSERPSARVYSSTNGSDYSSGQTGTSLLNLRIRGTSDADKKLADQIRQELRADTSLSALMSSVRISIENGKAVLRGSVKSEEDKQKIEKTIQKVTGVTSVENQLQVGSSAEQSGATEKSNNQ